MAIELITGRYGTPHIGSEDFRAYQAYTAGSGRYVLHGGGADVSSANLIHIKPAELLVDGAHVRITGSGEDVAIDNGASSYKRIDIIALHYVMSGADDSATESVTLEVVKGQSSDTTPSDPSMPHTGSILDNVSETYVPYVRVLIQGLTPQTPEVLLPDYVNPADIAGDGDQVDPSVLVDLGSGDADTIYKASPRPGVHGTLPASKGGTGQTSLQAARNAMGLGNTTGALPVANGGTGRASLMGSSGLLRALHENRMTNPEFFSVFSENWADGGFISKNDLLKLVYPVGAIYISYVSTSPASLFGGTWTPITGRFPYFNAGTGTGGSNTTSLSYGNMPSHNHAVAVGIENNGTGANAGAAMLYNIYHGGAGTLYTNSTGSGSSFNNMPSYQTLYAWRRTA